MNTVEEPHFIKKTELARALGVNARTVDNQPVAGCTGGALWSEADRPGLIYLQGDHTGVECRNLPPPPRVK